MIFTSTQREALSTPYPDRIARCIKQKDTAGAIALTREMAGSRILLHDFFADSSTVLWSFVGDVFGEETVEAMFRQVFAGSAQRQFFDAAAAQVLPYLSVYLLAKSWRAHSCFGAGEYPARFSIREDDEKFTFYLHPCASGQRLWKKGRYEPGCGGRLSTQPRPWTFNRNNFPYYCIHCAFLNEILPFESGYGALLWPVDPIKDPDDTCAWHVYKNPDDIPEHYYKRLGVARKPRPAGPYAVRPGRYFSDRELEQMSRPMTDRIIEALEKSHLRQARRLCRQVKDEFLVLHDLYVNMLAATLTFIGEKGGETALEEALERQYEKCVLSQFSDKLKLMTVSEKTTFLAAHLFGTDNCNHTGRYPGRFSIKETKTEIEFYLSPCGSGGRLIRAGSSDPQSRWRKTWEQVETTAITISARRLPFPEPLIQRIFPRVVNHFTQRKPYNLGRTQAARSWSFNRQDLPYFCCQCGMLQKKLGADCLTISPPTGRRQACVWRIKK